MKLIPLTKGYQAVVDDEDFSRVAQFKWHAKVDINTVYAARADCSHGRYCMDTIRLHRFILGVPPGVKVDHRDRDGLNNQKSNLRIATHAQNQRNSQRNYKHKASKYRGVTAEGAKWRARANLGGKYLNFGVFVVEEDAARAYDDGVAPLYGEFARFNFPERQLSHL